MFDGQPSFIILSTATKNERFIEEFRIGRREEMKSLLSSQHSIDRELAEIDSATIEVLERKKSSSLAMLLENRSKEDIPFEKFYLYEQFCRPTLEGPDEVYNSTNEEGDDIYTYIKAHEKDGVSFYYFVICLCLDSEANWSASEKIEARMEKEEDVDAEEVLESATEAVMESEALFPIISFPSLDGELYRTYKRGNLVSGNLKS